MSKAKPTYMRPILEDAISKGALTKEARKAARWALVTIDDLTARLAAAEALDRDYQEVRDRLDAANARLAAAEARNECPLCGLTPGAISTCYCEECVGEIKEKLAAAEAEVENLRLQCAAFDYSLTQAEDSAAARMQERDECRWLLREACEMPRYCTRFEEWKERAAKAGGGE